MNTPDYFTRLNLIVDGLNERFPDGNTPFQMVARLCEEAGELAKAVNHFERTGIKVQKYGEPDRAALAKEVQDVLRATLSIAHYYGIEAELQHSIEDSYQRFVDEGYIKLP
jgi:NTP pyrophosphatase (non-canonical NTP hydrolase)